MAVITATDMTGPGARTVTETTLGASDTFVYDAPRVLFWFCAMLQAAH